MSLLEKRCKFPDLGRLDSRRRCQCCFRAERGLTKLGLWHNTLKTTCSQGRIDYDNEPAMDCGGHAQPD